MDGPDFMYQEQPIATLSSHNNLKLPNWLAQIWNKIIL